jgi:hypothetical protein
MEPPSQPSHQPSALTLERRRHSKTSIFEDILKTDERPAATDAVNHIQRYDILHKALRLQLYGHKQATAAEMGALLSIPMMVLPGAGTVSCFPERLM